jgi:hypothetical protein
MKRIHSQRCRLYQYRFRAQEIDMFNRKPLMIAAAAATFGVAALSTQAYANDDAVLGAVIGAGVGAAIGHGVHGHDGALVGSAIGAIAGASIAANSSPYYDSGYYAAPETVYTPAPGYYDAAPAYYSAAPVYYTSPRAYYIPRVEYDHYYGPRHVDHRRSDQHERRDWHGDDSHQRH